MGLNGWDRVKPLVDPKQTVRFQNKRRFEFSDINNLRRDGRVYIQTWKTRQTDNPGADISWYQKHVQHISREKLRDIISQEFQQLGDYTYLL